MVGATKVCYLYATKNTQLNNLCVYKEPERLEAGTFSHCNGTICLDSFVFSMNELRMGFAQIKSMASFEARRTDNIEGEYFVDDTCISCAACWKAAPEIFSSHVLDTYAYVAKQPDSESTLSLCEYVLKLCPVGAIGRQST